MVDDSAWPADPAPFKRTNLLLHLLGGVLVFGLTRSLACKRLSGPNAEIAALLAAAAWLLHPMQLSTSMLVVQRMTQLMTLVSVATIWWASAYLQRKPLTLSRASFLLAGTAISTALAFLCKENGALLPLFVAVTCFVLLEPALTDAQPRGRRLLLSGLLLPILAVMVNIVLHTIDYVDDGLRTFTPAERVLTQPRVLLEYLVRLALPRLNGAGLFHDDYLPSRGLFDPIATFPALVACAGLIVAALAFHRRWPLFAFSVLWFFGGHLVESSTLPLELYFEHRNYLPMVGPTAATAIWLLSPQAPRVQRIAILAAIAWLALCAAMTTIQARVWGSEAMLANIWAKENPRSLRAVELHAKVLADSYQYDDAYKWLKDAEKTNPEVEKLALDLVLLRCNANKLTVQDLSNTAAKLRHSGFNRSSLEAMGTLQLQSQYGTCAPALTPESWQALAAAMLSNPVYRDNLPVAAYLWVEVAKSRIYQHRLDADDALEAAYAALPDARLALAAYEVMRNTGQCTRAERWRIRIRANPAPGFDGWMQKLARPQITRIPADECNRPQPSGESS